MADQPPNILERQPNESSTAFAAFQIYRDLGGKRSLSEVTERLATAKRGSGFRVVGNNDSGTKRVRKQGSGSQIGIWSSKFHWVERAAAWDRIVDARLRERNLDEIEKTAKRHADQAQLGIQALMAPVLAFARGLQDPNRAVSFDTADMKELLEQCIQTLNHLPRLQKAERLARGVKIVDTEPIANPASTQGGVEWRLTEYQPERKEPVPDLSKIGANEVEDWEE